MGGTLTLLIRHLVRRDPSRRLANRRALRRQHRRRRGGVLSDGLRAGAAFGLLGTQVSRWRSTWSRVRARGTSHSASGVRDPASRSRGTSTVAKAGGAKRPSASPRVPHARSPNRRRSTASHESHSRSRSRMSGFAAMGMEIVWFRHFTILLGGFRAVFSLLLTVILIGIGAGSLRRRRPRSPHAPAGDMADGRAGAVRRVHAARAGHRRRECIERS